MSAASKPAAGMRARRAIVIDDSGVERLLAAAMLAKFGFCADGAANAQAALAMVAPGRYVLALCDISLPDADGLSLLSTLRSADAALICLTLSSHDDRARSEEAMRRGAAAYLRKPLRLEQLADILRDLFPGPAD